MQNTKKKEKERQYYTLQNITGGREVKPKMVELCQLCLFDGAEGSTGPRR